MSQKKSNVNFNFRMDDLKKTVAEYTEGMARFSKNLEQAKHKTKSLEEKSLKERKLTSQAKVQLELLKGMVKEREERERCQTAVLKDMNAQADRLRKVLQQKLEREIELREKVDGKVNEIEGVSKDILFRFQSLKLNDTVHEKEESEATISEEISVLEGQISELKEEQNSLQKGREDRLPVDELNLIARELNAAHVKLVEENKSLASTVAKLEEELQQLNKGKTAHSDEGSAN
ncbi:immunoglobulin G-binding protein H-like [Palaemon carinicauda]|uniref:immunoglobulin G-binding protein H-like n=1 Tax=Palaemon carinicauda TaxID=392227 RepID=UPI0035B5B187